MDEAVYGLFRSLGSFRFNDGGENYLALDCVRRLAGKAHGQKLEARCMRRSTVSKYFGKELQEMLGSLRGHR